MTKEATPGEGASPKKKKRSKASNWVIGLFTVAAIVGAFAIAYWARTTFDLASGEFQRSTD